MVFEPQAVFGATQAVVGGAVDAPAPEHVSSSSGPKLQCQHAAGEAVVACRDFRSRLVWMRNQFDLDNPRPLDVVVRTFAKLGVLVECPGRFDPSDHEVAELSGLAVECSDVPT